MIEGKGLGNKLVNRVNLSLSNEYETKLQKLATACNKKPTTLARMLVERCLDDALIVNELQKEYSTQKAYKVVLIKNNGEIHYVLTGRDDL